MRNNSTIEEHCNNNIFLCFRIKTRTKRRISRSQNNNIRISITKNTIRCCARSPPRSITRKSLCSVMVRMYRPPFCHRKFLLLFMAPKSNSTRVPPRMKKKISKVNFLVIRNPITKIKRQESSGGGST